MIALSFSATNLHEMIKLKKKMCGRLSKGDKTYFGT